MKKSPKHTINPFRILLLLFIILAIWGLICFIHFAWQASQP